MRSVATSDNFEMEMPKGIYVLKVRAKAQKVLIH